MNAEISHIESDLPNGYGVWKDSIVAEIDKCRLASALKVNQELLQMYWFVGKQILEKQQETGWGGGVIDQLSKDLSALT